MRLVLEPRYLFDASVARTAKDIHHPAADAGPDHGHADAVHPDVPAASHPAAGFPAEAAPAHVRPGAVNGGEFLFVDPRVSNWQALAGGVKPGVSVVVLDPSKDGLAQVTGVLASGEGIRAVHFLTYGKPGESSWGPAM